VLPIRWRRLSLSKLNSISGGYPISISLRENYTLTVPSGIGFVFLG
jgi:hypothetical protein